MKIFLVFALLVFQIPNLWAQPFSNYWKIMAESNLTINVSTNVNEFSCNLENWNPSYELILLAPENSKLQKFKPNQILVKVNDLNCGNKIINADLQNTLMANKHPFIKIEFLEIVPGKGQNLYIVKLAIEIAGIKKTYQTYCGFDQENQIKNLNGCEKIKLPDFNLFPPEKFFGMVKVNDEIEVVFNFKFKDQ